MYIFLLSDNFDACTVGQVMEVGISPEGQISHVLPCKLFQEYSVTDIACQRQTGDVFFVSGCFCSDLFVQFVCEREKDEIKRKGGEGEREKRKIRSTTGRLVIIFFLVFVVNV